ncbi:hypothetical protein BWI97_15870 [Siphonobacter sp. BAB-5405]|uniref:hypothetical protein n=1 Tax=Siphonobacter sp. BAB-5405 TaxID=1864825 RepID=UPI000C80E20D|nr:hypothetical protein [Siphonobacter sp. BAB-5405]PMD94873.1 hypothetical protein BWI97_15870 [Siphonobacter sp. BAB-5405]
MKIDDIKAATGVAMSERLFNVPDPITWQCGKIDKVIEAIRSIERAVGKTENELKGLEGGEDALSSNSDAEYHTWGLTDKMEEIRKAIEGVREWGEAWKRLAKHLAEHVPDQVLHYMINPELPELDKLFPQFYENENA